MGVRLETVHMIGKVGSGVNIMDITFAFDDVLLKEATGNGFVVFDGHSRTFLSMSHDAHLVSVENNRSFTRLTSK